MSKRPLMSREMFSAWEEWWALHGREMLTQAQEQGVESGVEVDAFAAGAEWMRGECERIAAEWGESKYTGHDIARAIRALGGAQ